MYHFEGTGSSDRLVSMNTTSQYIVELAIRVEYSFRVRAIDIINRLGEWSASFIYSGFMSSCNGKV